MAGGVELLLLLFLFALIFPGGAATEELLHSKTFRSPGFEQGPGDVSDKRFEVEMPQGYVAIRSLGARLVDEHGALIPPSETYVHHWLLNPRHPSNETGSEEDEKESALWFGLGSEISTTTVPSPYGVVIGNQPMQWGLSVHAIDTRGAVDVRGCTECVCRLYNVSVDENGKPLGEGYEGGHRCCYDRTHCAVRPEFQGGARRMLFLEYTVTWVDMSDEVVAVRVHVFDVRAADQKSTVGDERHCNDIEYTVPKCSEGESECVHRAEDVASIPDGGDVIFAVGHQHNGGMGATLLKEDGEEICSSVPTYGDGSEAANEVGYIIRMSSCYPEPGSVKVKGGEKLLLTSSYNNQEQHTGVMGIFYLLVAESQLPPKKRNFHTNMILVAAAVMGTFIFIGMTISRQLKGRRGGPDYTLV